MLSYARSWWYSRHKKLMHGDAATCLRRRMGCSVWTRLRVSPREVITVRVTENEERVLWSYKCHPFPRPRGQRAPAAAAHGPKFVI